jgi:hypothetical protein
MELGTASVRLTLEQVSFVPSRLHRARGGKEVAFPYDEIAGLSMVEPRGLGRGTLTVRMTGPDAEAYTVSFRSPALADMRRIQRELWRRARAARSEGTAPVT